MSPQPIKVDRLAELQERQAEIQRLIQECLRESHENRQNEHRVLVGHQHDWIVTTNEIAEIMGVGIGTLGDPTQMPGPLQSPDAVRSLSLVAPALAPAPSRKDPRPAMLTAPAGRPLESRHPFPHAVGNVKAWAREHGLHYSMVKAWYTEGAFWKPIPRKWANLLASKYGVPLRAWKGRQAQVTDRKTGKLKMIWREGITDDVRAGKSRPNPLRGPRSEEMKAMRATGKTYQEIADAFGISYSGARLAILGSARTPRPLAPTP